MTRSLLRTIQAEYEHTNANIGMLCEKYDCTTKDLKGYTTWKKTVLSEDDTVLKQVYNKYTEQVPAIEEQEVIGDTDDDFSDIELPSTEDKEEEDIGDSIVIEMTPEEIKSEVVSIAADISAGKVIDVSQPSQLQQSLEGMRKLDVKMQAQALRLLGKIDTLVEECETARDIKDLIQAHTSIRDSYFNTKAPMINILNGDVVQGDKSELATFISSVDDDC